MKAGTVKADSITLNWDTDPLAKSYIIHFIEKGTSDAHEMVKMGYVEGNTWTLDDAKFGSAMSGKTFTFAIQAYYDLGVGSNETEKARHLHDGEFVGSEWSRPFVVVTAK